MRIEYIIDILQNSSLSVFILLILLMIFPLGKVSARSCCTSYSAQTMNFSIKDFFSKCETVNVVTFTE